MKGLIFHFILFFMMIIPSGGVFPEAPDRQALENQLIVVRQHGFWPQWVEYDGIWQFNLETQEYKRLRHIFFSPASEYSAALNWGYLGSEGDRLISQAWPDDLWFDMFTMRMENRIPVPNADSTHGWALQGPILDAEELDGTGLPAGRYGFIRCVVSGVNGYQEVCEEFDFPGNDGSVFEAIDRFFLFNEQNRGTVLSAEPVVEFSPPFALIESQIHSYDIGRKGFWRGTDREALFYPVRDGSFLEPSLEVDFSALVGTQGSEWIDWSLGTLFYHAKNERLFGLFRFVNPEYYNAYAGRVFFSSAPDANSLTLIEVGDATIKTGLPVWFGAFDSAPSTFEQIVPIVADTEGDNGTHWVTDLWLYNPSDDATTITIGRLTSEAERIINLPAHGSVHLENVLSWIGGGPSGDGVEHDALFVSSPYHWGQQLSVVGRMWTRDESTGGTFGHAVPTVPAPYGFSNHHGSADDSIWLTMNESHIDLDLRQSGQFRHNLGITNVLDRPIQITLNWAWFEGMNEHLERYKPESLSQTIEVPPRTILILRPEEVFPEEVRGWPPRIAIRSDSPALIWFSMVDNLTGDATFAPYANYTYVAAEPYSFSYDIEKIFRRTGFVLPVAVSAPGKNGTIWQTDLIGYDGRGVHHFSDQVYAAFWPSTAKGNCTVVGSFIAQLLQGELAIPIDTWYNTLSEADFHVPSVLDPNHLENRMRTIFPDVVHLFEECADTQDIKGGVGVRTGSWFSGFSRTYTTQPDGGTYGAMLPLYPPNGWPVQHFAGLELNDQTRINIGFFNGDFGHTITHRVTLYAEDGLQVAQRSFTLDPFDSKQLAIQNLFNGVDLQPGTYGLTVLPLDQEAVDEDPGFQGHSWAYVSVIDNLTNDPINLW